MNGLPRKGNIWRAERDYYAGEIIKEDPGGKWVFTAREAVVKGDLCVCNNNPEDFTE